MEPNLAWLATNFVAAFLLPPLNLILLMVAGLFLLKRKPQFGKALLVVGILGLYALSTPLVAGFLLGLLQTDAPVTQTELQQAKAIVVLGAGRYSDAPEYGSDTTSALGLERLRYAAYLHRLTGLPILATGGSPNGGIPESTFMKEILEKEFAVPVKWTEGASNNTRENAIYSKKILEAEGIKQILLVTHAWHLPRARFAFEHAGLHVIAAGTHFVARASGRILDFVPDAGALRSSAYALHEYVGIIWYWLRG